MDETDKDYEVIISDRASYMLVSHIRFLAQVSVKAAHNLREEIIASAFSLQKMPERNIYLDNPVLPPNKYRKALVAKRYLLIYQIKNNTVYIDYILDCRQGYNFFL